MPREPRRRSDARRSARERGPARTPPSRAARAWWIAAAVLTLAGIVLRFTLPPVRERTPDEQVYATFAAGFAQIGFGRYAEVVANFGRDADLAQLPPPTRVGYLWIAVAAMGGSGGLAMERLVALSTWASVLLLIGTVAAAGRLPGGAAAAVAAALLVASPIDLAIARRAWQDGVFAVFGAGAAAALAWAAARSGTRRGRALPAVAFFLAAGYAVLIKESALPLLALGTGLLAAWAWRDGGFRAAWPIVAGGAVTLAVVMGALAALCGGWDVLLATWTRLIAGADTNEYVLRYQTGGPTYYVRGLAILQPVAAALAALGTVAALVRPGWLAPDPAARRALLTLAAWTAGFAIFAALWSQKNVRFLSPMLAPATVLAAAFVVAALREVRARSSTGVLRAASVAVAVALALAIVQDLRRFQDFFVRRGIPDLATPWFTAP